MRNVLRFARERAWFWTCCNSRPFTTVDLYESISDTKSLKHAATPFVPDGSATIDDEEAKGELAPNACRILMKALWLGRLSRPDIIKTNQRFSHQSTVLI